ncbi:MAG TPA: sulfate ABC transporter substrate-binding protein [Anaerolineae bacterium]
MKKIIAAVRAGLFVSLLVGLLAGLLAGLLVGCGGSGSTASTGQPTIKLTLGAYTTPREAYASLTPIFREQWKKETGQEVTFEESYQASGAQSRAIVEGFEADIAALSLEGDIDRIAKAGLISHDWKEAVPYNGMVSTSIVVIGMRPGNPKGIQGWADLAKPGVEVLTPNPKTSGGAQWNILALYGAARRGFVEGVPANDDAAAMEFLMAVLKNVSVMDKGARESITNFEKGIGDAIITYENEILVAQQQGQAYEYIIPRSTILIENPIAVVDTYVDKHGTRPAAEAFVKFLFTRQAQEVFAQHGLRSPDPEVATATASQYPPVEDLFTVAEFGGWTKIADSFFDDDGIYTQAIANVQSQ